MSAVSSTAAPAAVRVSVLAAARRASLPLIFAISCTYQFLEGRAHVTATVFDDELLYAKLSQSIAAGHGLTIRGVHYAFPSPVASLLQAPAWLFGSTTDGYAAAKLLNAVLMSAAVFPAYWLARRLVRPSFALVVAAATVATPAMMYHAYLMSEAAAYPIFVLAVAVLVRAAAQPSRMTAVAVPAVCMLAVATRVQFVVLPLGYIVAVAVCGRWRKHVLPLVLLAAGAVAAALVPGSLGTYADATQYHYGAQAVAHWALTNVSLLPFSLGLAVVPGALLGVGYAIVRPRSSVERAFAAVAATVTVLFVAQAAVISAGEAHRPLERYLFYVTPLVFVSFFLYVERRAPRRIAYAAVAGVLAFLLSQMSLPGLTGTAAFFFDSVTETAFARAAFRFGIPDASLLFAVLPVALAVVTTLVPLRRPSVALGVAGAAIAVQLAFGGAVATTDHLVTRWARRTFAASPPNWLDRSHLGDARYLVLPDANPFLGTSLESWNRSVRGMIVLQAPAPDPYARSVARIDADGALDVDGRPARAQLLVVNTSETQIGIDGRVVARPLPGLVAVRIPANAHVHWLARGLAPDGWTGRRLRYTIWRRGGRNGYYTVDLSLPRGYDARHVEVGLLGGNARAFSLAPRSHALVRIPAPGRHPEPLVVTVQVPPGPLGTRTLGVRVTTLRYTAGP